MQDWQFWIGALALAGFGNIGAFWYGYGRLNQKVDGVLTRLDRINGRLDRHDGQIVDTQKAVARMQGEHEARTTLG